VKSAFELRRWGRLPSSRVAVLACGLASVSVAGQTPTFLAGVDSVAIYVTVSGSDGRLVPDLPREAFQILDDGRPIATTLFSNDPQPLTVAVMLDMSGSMLSRLLWIRDAAGAFVDALEPVDRVCIGSFGLEVAVSPRLTGDHAILKRILRDELWPGGSTPLWEGVDAAMNTLGREPGRRAILVVSDGMSSRTDRVLPGDLRQRAAREGFMIYAVSVDRKGLGAEMRDLAQATGGGYVILNDATDLAAALARVAVELRHQYVLGFSPSVLDGKLHKVAVRMNAKDLTARAPERYYAVEKRR
jgi:Ca-activated chloride channel homolog